MGAPNLVRGGSHAGNVATVDLAKAGLLDVLSSDYMPASLLIAALRLPEAVPGVTLAAAVRTVSKTPAEAVGLDDRGEIAVGKRADLIRVRVASEVPVVRADVAQRDARRMSWIVDTRAFLSARRDLIGPGRLVLVVGPSGAGKDTLIAGARAACADDASVVFPRRVVTRPSSAAEDHDTMATDEFTQAVADGAFALWWEAHGNRYGIPSAIDDDIRAGRTVVCNVRGRSSAWRDGDTLSSQSCLSPPPKTFWNSGWPTASAQATAILKIASIDPSRLAGISAPKSSSATSATRDRRPANAQCNPKFGVFCRVLSCGQAVRPPHRDQL